MAKREIKSFSHKIGKRFVDKIGALEKGIKMKRMEPYADVIRKVFAKYNTDADKKTMMFKLLREPVQGTTTRKSHAENVAEIAKEIADAFDWLCSDLVEIMGENHDLGHISSGHSGEWWISDKKDILAMGVYVHNAIGARNLVYRNDIFTEVETAIKKAHPDINPKTLASIKRDIWLIVDGINCHNGEKSEFSYAPDFSKKESRFLEEIMGCFTKKGYDKTLMPATAEGSLMRLCDKISYIPFDMVDIFRNGCNIKTYKINGQTRNFYEEYQAKFTELNNIAKRTGLKIPPISVERLLACRTQEEYDAFAFDMQQIFIADVIKNTRRNNIRMSSEMSDIMHGIRNINNSMMVNYVVLEEDHQTYPAAMEKLMQMYAKALIQHGLVEKDVRKSSIIKMEDDSFLREQFISTYELNPVGKKFAEFITKTSKRDFEFTVQMLERAFDETIDNELQVAESIVSGKMSLESINVTGDRKIRIENYVAAMNNSLNAAYTDGHISRTSTSPINSFKKKVWLSKTKKGLKKEISSGDTKNPLLAGCKSLQERVALELGAQFLASLNDEEWKQLLIDAKIVDEAQLQSLTRKYSKINFREEAKPHIDWYYTAKAQQAASTEATATQPKGFLSRVQSFLGFERE